MTSPAEAVEQAAARLSNDLGTFPRQFGNYLLLQMIARGGMGEVYLAKQGGIAGIEKNCVVKTLRGHFTVDREYVNRFMDEARVVVHLTHRNICQVYDVGKVKGKYYLAMEHIVGRDLRSLLQDPRVQGQFTPAMLLHIVCEVLEALDYAHRLKDPASGDRLHVVHRDVSPQNIMLNFEGEVKLIDFGLAASSKKVEKTQPNVVMGKMAYMAPEQARGDAVDGRADLFAVAVLAYEMLVGQRFYEGMSFEEMWGVAGRGGYRPRNWATLDPSVRAILDRGLAADLELRYQTCGDFKEALSNYLFQNQMRASARDMRRIMEDALGADLQQVRDLLGKYANVRMGPSADEESETFIPSRAEATMTGSVPLMRSSSDASAPTAADGQSDKRISGAAFLAPLPTGPGNDARTFDDGPSDSTSATLTGHQGPARSPDQTLILRDMGFREESKSVDAPVATSHRGLKRALFGVIGVLSVVAIALVVMPSFVDDTRAPNARPEEAGLRAVGGSDDVTTPPTRPPEVVSDESPPDLVVTLEANDDEAPEAVADSDGADSDSLANRAAVDDKNEDRSRSRSRRRSPKRRGRTTPVASSAGASSTTTPAAAPTPAPTPTPAANVPPFPNIPAYERIFLHASRHCGAVASCKSLPSAAAFKSNGSLASYTAEAMKSLNRTIRACKAECSP